MQIIKQLKASAVRSKPRPPVKPRATLADVWPK